MELLQPLFEPFSCAAGTVVLQQGMPADYLYLIVNGKVEISYKPYDGATITVSHVDRGGLFGWSAVVGSPTYTSSATAIKPLSAMRLRGNDLRQLCIAHPEAGKDIMAQLASSVSSRWANANDQVKSILAQGVRGK
jgi:CRP-like cAMP-binding protein